MTHHYRSLLTAMVIFLLTAVVPSVVLAQGWDSADDKPGGSDPIWLDQSKTVELLEAGTGWSRIRLFDPASASFAVGEELLVITRQGLNHVPLTEADRLDLAEDFPQPMGHDFEGASGFAPLEYVIVSPVNLDSTRAYRGLCDWDGSEFQRDFSFDRTASSNPWNYNSGPFQGSFEADLPIQGNASVSVNFEVKRCLGVPIKWRMRDVLIDGQATIAGTARLQGSVNYSWNIEREHRILRVKLGQVSVYGIPIKFYLTGHVGFSADASIAANLGVTAHLDGSGTFTVRCNRDNGCNNNSQFVSTATSELTAGLQADAEIRAWGKVGVRAAVVDDSIAYVQVAVRGWAGGDLWGYFGNNCGDADGDGQSETVRALAADVRAGYEVDLEVDTLLTRSYDTTIHDDEWLIGWYDLLGDTTAFEPMVLGPAHLEPGETGAYTARMRPCYPYDKAVTIEWPPGFAGGSTITHPRTGTVSATGSFDNGPTRSLDVTARRDTYGRELDATHRRTIVVADRQDPPVIDLDPVAETVAEGATATLTVQASGDGPLHYQWQKDGADIGEIGRFSGTQTATLTVTDVNIATVGRYRVVVSNIYGTATSNEAYLSLEPECQVTLLRASGGNYTPPVIRWQTDCEEDGNTDVVVRTSTVGVTPAACIVDREIWHAALSGEAPANYMVGGYYGGCPVVQRAKFWVELIDRRDQRQIAGSSPVYANYVPPSSTCSITDARIIDNGPGQVPTVQWSTDCPEFDPMVKVTLRASTVGAVPPGCEKDAERIGPAASWGARDIEFMAGGYGEGNACPPVNEAWLWIEVHEMGYLTERTDYMVGHYQP